jgi:hypothetical protein
VSWLRPWPKRPPRDVSGQHIGLVVVVRMATSVGAGPRCLVRCEGKLPNGSVCGVERIANVANLLANPPKTHVPCDRARRIDAGP